MSSAVVIGAGIGGLTTAAVLARAGMEVAVLEAQVYPGGCASTYFHQGYRFDAGATLAGGFYPCGPMDKVALAVGISAWPVHPAAMAMVVHMPDGTKVTRHAGESRLDDYVAAFGNAAVDLFRWQERTADGLWDLALRLPPWPPQSISDWTGAAVIGFPWLLKGNKLRLAADAFRPVASHLRAAPDSLRLFIDAQLLISAQATSQNTNALYGAAALDLPRRGVVHFSGGIGAIAETLVDAVRSHGGRVLYRHEVTDVRTLQADQLVVKTRQGGSFPADLVIFNLTPWDALKLLEDNPPASLRHLPPQPSDGWGAFVVYVGLDDKTVPPDYPLHHQIIVRRPLGEGNSVFASLSPAWDSAALLLVGVRSP